MVMTAKEFTAAERERLLRQAKKVIAKGRVGLTCRGRRRGGAAPARARGTGRNVNARERSWSKRMPKVLLVEDNEMNRDMLSRRLIRRGYEVLSRWTASRASTSLAANGPTSS